MVLWNNFSVRKNSGIEPVLANPQQHRNPASMNKVTSNTSWYRLGFASVPCNFPEATTNTIDKNGLEDQLTNKLKISL
jgi:hypothetical protein